MPKFGHSAYVWSAISTYAAPNPLPALDNWGPACFEYMHLQCNKHVLCTEADTNAYSLGLWACCQPFVIWSCAAAQVIQHVQSRRVLGSLG